MSQPTRWSLTLLLAALLSGCGGEARMTVDLPPEDRLPGLSLRVEDRDGTRRFTRADLAPRDGGLTTGAFEVAEEGSIRIRIRLEDEGATVADGSLELQAREAFRWTVVFLYDTSDPTADCFGCLGSVSIPVAEGYRTAPDEALWGYWAGRREDSDVVF